MKFAPKTFKDQTIYHPNSIGCLTDACESMCTVAETLGQPLTLYFNGTLVTVTPEMTAEQAALKWDTDRDDYQKEKPKKHAALCPCQQ
jgi:hypothetical protein